MKQWKTFALAGLIAVTLLSGCSSANGGDTKCGDFNSADDKTQRTAVGDMLKDEKGADATELEITGTRLSVQTFCQTVAKADSTIKEAPHL